MEAWLRFIAGFEALCDVVPLWLAGAIVAWSTVTLTYYAHGTLYLPLDYFKWPRFLYKYKIQDEPFDPSTMPALLKSLTLGSIFSLLPSSVLFGIGMAYGRVRVDGNLPSLLELVASFAVFMLLEEVLFYYAHVILHTPVLYKYVHKVHHEYKQPIALAAGHAHVAESFIGNAVLLLGLPLLLGSHLSTAMLWMVVSTISTQLQHCGFRMPWQLGSQPNFHDFHHSKHGFRSNFGLLGIMDRLHGTDSHYRTHLQKGKTA